MNELDIVSRRRAEVQGNIAKARATIEQAQKIIDAGNLELEDLEIAGRTIARLMGAEWPPGGEENSVREATNIGRRFKVEDASVKPSMPQMIVTALQAARQNGRDELEPKTIAAVVDHIFHNKPEGSYVSSIVWRMWKRGQLIKTPAGAYKLAGETNEATDLLSGQEQSAASDQSRAQGGEARPGGGT